MVMVQQVEVRPIEGAQQRVAPRAPWAWSALRARASASLVPHQQGKAAELRPVRVVVRLSMPVRVPVPMAVAWAEAVEALLQVSPAAVWLRRE